MGSCQSGADDAYSCVPKPSPGRLGLRSDLAYYLQTMRDVGAADSNEIDAEVEIDRARHAAARDCAAAHGAADAETRSESTSANTSCRGSCHSNSNSVKRVTFSPTLTPAAHDLAATTATAPCGDDATLD